jgi:serine/threonine protein kinase
MPKLRCDSRKRKQRKQRKTRKRKQGGKISGRGAFGCVITPPVPCSNSTIYSNPEIASYAVKLYAPSVDARNKNRVDPAFPTEDIKADAILKRIPNALTYFVLPFAHCDISEANVERYEDTRECAEQMRLYPKKLLWMQAADGDVWGAIFGGTLFQEQSQLTLLNGLRNVLLGIQILHENGIVHRDIKPDNILYGSVPIFWIKLADFGEAMLDPLDFSELVKEDLNNLYYTYRMVFTKMKIDMTITEPFLELLKMGSDMSHVITAYDALVSATSHSDES